MADNGINKLDAIGSTFHKLFNMLREPLTEKSVSLKISDINPALVFNKDSLRFVHDLIYIAGPVNRIEIIEILKELLGKHDFKKITEHIALLSAFNAISAIGKNIYRSNLTQPYLCYDFDVNIVVSAFRNFMLKYKPERIYGT